MEMCSGIVGFHGHSAASQDLVREWASCATRRGCIAPEGSSKQNHRQDQTALNLLLYHPRRRHQFEMLVVKERFFLHAPAHLSRVTDDCKKQNGAVFFIRRDHLPQPYARMLVKG
jgi:hypothetical protein